MKTVENTTISTNALYPIFVKFENFDILIVGGGNVGLEKITSVLNNSPRARVTLVGETILPEIQTFAANFENVILLEKAFEPSDLDDKNFAIIATDNKELNHSIKLLTESRRILTNVADTPDLCDFYLSSIVQKGDLKIAISTNGKSPTIAKRLKEVLNAALPNELDAVLQNMHQIRNKLNGNFAHKVKVLNRLTRSLAINGEELSIRPVARAWKRIATIAMAAFGLLLFANIIFVTGLHDQVEPQFWAFLLIGFLAQMVDGMLGMGYGVTSAIGLMTMNVNVAAISSSIHTAEIFTAGASGYSHYKFGNINKKLFKAILIPGIIGAIAGALLLMYLDVNGSKFVKPLLAVYMMVLGVRILTKAFQQNAVKKKVKNVGWLAGAGGFLDSFGSGGWGPLVTGTLITKGKTPRYVVGSVSLSEFFVTLASALTFFTVLGIQHWQVTLGLLLGGVVAAPIAARLAGKLPRKQMMIGVGCIIVIWSLQIFLKLLF
ncbi:MAG: TSUP family transporter [Saprospiraceae bacterium]|nr:TSUP family transporter [Saprospiraceae bacterium]